MSAVAINVGRILAEPKAASAWLIGNVSTGVVSLYGARSRTPPSLVTQPLFFATLHVFVHSSYYLHSALQCVCVHLSGFLLEYDINADETRATRHGTGFGVKPQ